MAALDLFEAGTLPNVPSADTLREIMNHSPDEILLMILAVLVAVNESAASGGGGGGGTVTPHFQLLGESDSVSIPSGVKGWTATILTGTGAIGGVAIPAGFSDSDTGTLAAAITVQTDAVSSGYVRWNT